MHHVILGAGPAGVTAAETIRKHDAGATITLIGGEPEPPYARMAIPYYLEGKILEDGTHLRSDPEHYQSLGINYRQGRAVALDSKAKQLKLAAPESMEELIPYDRLLISTGASPVHPPIKGIQSPGVHTCWTLDDARHIAALAKKGEPVVLVGAGFIGSIILEALAKKGVHLTVVETGDRMVPRMLDETAGNMLKSWCENKGVSVLTGTSVASIALAETAAATASTTPTSASAPPPATAAARAAPPPEPPAIPKKIGLLQRLFGYSESSPPPASTAAPAPITPDPALKPQAMAAEPSTTAASTGHGLTVTLSNGETLPAALVVIATGVRPNIEFLTGSGLDIDQGIKVDEHFATSVPDVYAAGDIAEAKDLSTGSFDVLAIQPVAVEHGYLAGLNMAGIPSTHQGSLNMNVLDTIGLISVSFGSWMGVPGGERANLHDPAEWRYIRLEFSGDRLIGAQCVGLTQNVGMLRGLIQTGQHLGHWKDVLLRSPERIAEAYVATTCGL